MSFGEIEAVANEVSRWAVLVSLVYVAIQTRQNVRHTRDSDPTRNGCADHEHTLWINESRDHFDMDRGQWWYTDARAYKAAAISLSLRNHNDCYGGLFQPARAGIALR